MTRHPSRSRTPLAALVLLALALGLFACGGSHDPKTTDDPTQTPPTGVTPSPSQSPTPTADPLSPFEDQPPVQAARAWAAAMARSVNARDRSLHLVAPLATTRGLDLSKNLAQNDIDKNLLRPGPQPFTPVNVQIKGRLARLNTCYLSFGWALDRKTQKPAEQRKIEPIVLEMRKVGGAWKFDYGQKGAGDCDGVQITPVRW